MLNAYTEENIRDLLRTAEERLTDKKWGGADVWSLNSHAARVTLWAVWDAWSMTACCRQALGFSPANVRSAFGSAAETVTLFFELCRKRSVEVQSDSVVHERRTADHDEVSIPAPSPSRGDYTTGLVFALLGGAWSARARLLRLNDDDYRGDRDEEARMYGKRLMPYQLGTRVRRLLMSGNYSDAAAILPELERGELAARFDAGDSGLLAREVRAIVDGDSEALARHLSVRLANHERAAKRGFLRERTEGLLSMPSLAIVRHALEHGMRLEISNPYLPLDVIDYELTPPPSPAGPSPPSAASSER